MMGQAPDGNGLSWEVIIKMVAGAAIIGAFTWAVTNASQIQTNTRALAVHEIKITNLEVIMRESNINTEKRLARIEAKLDELIDRRGR